MNKEVKLSGPLIRTKSTLQRFRAKDNETIYTSGMFADNYMENNENFPARRVS